MISAIKEKITKRLAKSPITIISVAIYGSWAKGTQMQDSDLDILMISDEINPKKHKRGREIARIKESLSLGFPLDILLLTPDECISNFRNHNPLFLDIAWDGIILIDKNDLLKNVMEETKEYTIQRKIEKFVDGWKFPVLYRQATFLSEVSNRDFAVVMLTDAERDLTIGINITEDGYFDKAVYHFQQAVEKAVKAVLISFGEFKKTHFVGSILSDKLKNIELNHEWKEKLLYIAKISDEIEPEVTWSRYPGIDRGVLWIPYEEYTVEDAHEIKEKCEKAIKIVREFLGWWFKIPL